ncbi:hypothetical protein TM233_42030 [Bradyrhizobium sp. TM233]|nr:hypothetical protein TM233_42030 [Bradyrhizobium sp. TM233]
MSCPLLWLGARLRAHDDVPIQSVDQRRDHWAQIVEYEDRFSLAHQQYKVVLSGCSDNDLCEEEGRAGPAGSQQQMALGDGIVAAIAFVREYLPFRVTSACGRILWRYAEIHRRVDLGEFSPTLN